MVRLTLLKFEDGTWDQAKGTLRDDLDTIELAFNRGMAELTAAVVAAAAGGSTVTVEDMIPVALLTAGASNAQPKKGAVSDDPFAPAMLLMGAGPRGSQSVQPADPLPSVLLLMGVGPRAQSGGGSVMADDALPSALLLGGM